MTQRIEPFFLTWLKDLTFFSDSQTWTFFFLMWLEELDFFFGLKVHFFFKKKKVTQRIELFFSQNVSKNWTSLSYELFFSWLKELNSFFFQYDSKNWFLFNDAKSWTPFWICPKELNLFFFEYDSKNWPCFLNMTQRIETVFWNVTQKLAFLVEKNI